MSLSQNAAPSFGRRGVAQAQVLARRPVAAGGSAATQDAEVTATMLSAYVGRNLHNFERTIDAMDRKDDGFKSVIVGWCWPAFFVPVIWLAYRKMWAAAALFYFALLVLTYLAGSYSGVILGAYIAFAVMAKSLYLRASAGKIRRILATASSPPEAAIAIREAGGVTVGGAWIAVFLNLLPVVVIVATAVAQS